VLTGERHNDWSRRVVTTLSGARWPIGDGMVGCLVEAVDGPGRALLWDRVTTGRCLTGGPLTAEEARLIGANGDPIVAADRLGAWWPGCGLAGLAWTTDADVVLSEVEGDRRESVRIGRFQSA